MNRDAQEKKRICIEIEIIDNNQRRDKLRLSCAMISSSPKLSNQKVKIFTKMMKFISKQKLSSSRVIKLPVLPYVTIVTSGHISFVTEPIIAKLYIQICSYSVCSPT